jgi:hypothetical protein
VPKPALWGIPDVSEKEFRCDSQKVSGVKRREKNERFF